MRLDHFGVEVSFDQVAERAMVVAAAADVENLLGHRGILAKEITGHKKTRESRGYSRADLIAKV
ncbi:hypothetical protein GCM10023155_22480 [Bremerella cremea]